MKVLLVVQPSDESAGKWLAAHLKNNGHEVIQIDTTTSTKTDQSGVDAVISAVSKPIELKGLDPTRIISINIKRKGVRGEVVKSLNELRIEARISHS
jgi:hypothetical protein